jgi:hypothetical protein
MSEKLLESDFLTIDLKSIISKQQNTEETKARTPTGKAPRDNSSTPIPKSAKMTNTKIDWSKELKKRLDDNKKLDAESRKTDFDIETEFWLEFFTSTYDENIAKLLNNIELLKKDIQILGFKKQTNPILAFFKIKYVQKDLISTKLINSNSYTAIHNAIAKRLVSGNEFLKANDYNIIYCRDLYRRSLAEIVKYLEYQAKILPPNIVNYDEDRVIRNKQIFLTLGTTKVTAASAKLNSLKEIEKMLGMSVATKNAKDDTGNTGNEVETADTDKTVNFNGQKDLAAFIATPAHAFATLQFLGMAVQSTEALDALTKYNFTPAAMEGLAKASKELADKLHKINFSKKDLKVIVPTLIKRAGEHN